MKYNTATPYIASYVILRKNGKVAFVLRENTTWMNGYYGLPSGKVEKNERFLKATVREAKEEAGVDIELGNLEPVHMVHRKEPDMTWVDLYFEATKWEGEPHNAEPHVHSELAWLDPKKLPKNTIPCIRYALEQIEAGKIYSEYGWEE